ncbi:MAG: TetR/AcrR family transcriptional regulator [Coleofasciculus sp. B1-GNL1-01]|uniref:TetR/AcrR family transcriptional regulator n=1 Tax=Coleofasciculus sp. B1-GNL1-01 TaxID=3068484 RepID=UPI0032FCD512
MNPPIQTDTKEQILNVAERLFANQGFAGTSLRCVIREAGVNLAAVHYHFGSKEELFRAVVSRIAKPVVAAQLERLAHCQAQNDPPSVEAILEALLTPPLQIVLSCKEHGMNRAQFMGRCRTEPEPIQTIARQEFQASHQVFLDTLQRSLPDQSRTELSWKFDLAIAALIRVATEAGKPNALLQGDSPKHIHLTVSRLVHFLTPGIRADSTHRRI